MTMNSVEIIGHTLGDGHPCYIIGEIGLNHNGDLSIAKELLRLVADSGCDAIKFQKRNVAGLAIKSILDAKDDRFPEFGSTYREIRNHLEFDFPQYKELMNECSKRNVSFLCTAFDIESVNVLEQLGVRAYKLASHSLTNIPLLECVARIGKPTILSTGMATLDEVDRAVNIFISNNVPLVLLHCVSSYPQPIEDSNLRLIEFYKKRYKVPVGYSGHEIGWLPTMVAVARGACVVERHITLDNKMIGFDHKLSLMPNELADMVRDIRNVEASLGTGKKCVSETEQVTRNKYHVSWVSKVNIPRGTLITEELLTLKNPGTGMPAHKRDLLIGKKAVRDIPKDSLLDMSFVQK